MAVAVSRLVLRSSLFGINWSILTNAANEMEGIRIKARQGNEWWPPSTCQTGTRIEPEDTTHTLLVHLPIQAKYHEEP